MPYRFKKDAFNNFEKRVIQGAINEYSERSCVDWVVATDLNEHYVEFIKDAGCYSYVGKVNLVSGI